MILGRVDDELKKILNEIFAYGLNDPRIDGMVSVTRVQTTKDLKYAKVFVSIFNSNNPKLALKAIAGASGHIRSIIASKVKIRNIPSLSFSLDEGMEYSDRMNKLFKELNITPASKESESEDE